ncbi:hypothetical protein Pcinc_010858 [Petrolisthes cinctipes]|uniref:Uncharacterized protein n=1 Tax=Petrolisthes cinctipes TaxID=88211 RepID=A0AAE1G434_PETCI|nr:hypothetical protein Pcinc_010858 [Petrolisthes cinctipes]
MTQSPSYIRQEQQKTAMENEECRNCWETHPCPRHSTCCVKGSRSKKKGDRFMTYDPLRCITCQAFIAESENGVAAAQAELRKLFAIRGHRQRSRCPNAELMNFFSSEEDTNRLLNLARYVQLPTHKAGGANTFTMKVSESATQAETLSQAVASILSHPSPKPLAEEQSFTPRRAASQLVTRGPGDLTLFLIRPFLYSRRKLAT